MSTQRIHDFSTREGFTGRAYWLNIEGHNQRVLVRPHQVQLEADTNRPSNLTFCVIDEAEYTSDIERSSAMIPRALAAIGVASGPKAKRD